MNKMALQRNKAVTANIFSYLTFWWLNSLFKKGSKKSLCEDDMYELTKNDTSVNITERLERNWKKEFKKHRQKASLWWAIIRTDYARFCLAGIFMIFEEILLIIQPFMVAGLIRYFENIETTPIGEAYTYAAVASFLTLFLAFFEHIVHFHIMRLGWHLRVATCTLMYKKTLRLSQKALGQTTTGQVVNLSATDVNRFDHLYHYLHFIWIAPLQLVVVIYLLWDDIGVSVLAGIGVLTFIMIVQSLSGRLFGKLRLKAATLTDERVKVMNEVITGMRIIKMYTWENPFAELVEEIRKKELRKVMWLSFLRAFIVSNFFTATKVISCVTFITFVLTGGELTASVIFKVIGVYNVIQITVGLMFPSAIAQLAEASVAVRRIQKFLLLDERERNSTTESESSEKCFVEMSGVSSKWPAIDDENGNKESNLTLKNINIRVEPGQLLAVIGPVGAGKSSLLSALLGELSASSGKVTVKGKVTFSGQVPWVFAGTVRQNILFGEKYDAHWFHEVVNACGLEKDLELLEHGDLTLVGERGVTLSGGQKARVNLARAAYRKNASICLLDDPLSAVDVTVGNHIFDQCICGIMKDKVRILVTHQLQLLKNADEIIILKEGEIVGQGSYDQLQADGTDFAALLQENKKEEEEDVLSCCSDVVGENAALLRSISHQSKQSSKMASSTLSLKSLGLKDEDAVSETSEEMRQHGSVSWRVYVEYLCIGTCALFYIVFGIVIILNHLTFLACEWWISIWASSYREYVLKNATTGNQTLNTTSNNSTVANSSMADDTIAEFDSNYFIICYGVITLGAFFSLMFRAAMHFYLCISSGILMHNKMFRSILRAPIRFFDTNPTGRVLNRFSKDIGHIDDTLPMVMFDFLLIMGVIFSTLIIIIITNYMILIPIFPLMILFVWVRQRYVKTSRDIKRLEAMTRSPVFSLLSSTLQGLSTIRAFHAEDDFLKDYHQKQDLHGSAWYLSLAGSVWFTMRIDALGCSFIAAVAILSVATLSIVPLDPSEVGLIVTYSISVFAGMFQWGIRQSAEMENQMTSVERVQQYYRIPPEALEEVPEKKPPLQWPNSGSIVFQNMSFAHYTGGPNVLTKIGIKINSQEKVGIVGRTGAGKSSLISALFRLSEFSGGDIVIDGIPISQLGLKDLRNCLSIIPQDPVLFTGTMSRNLDPFGQYTDEELWHALEQVQLKEFVESLPLKLKSELAEYGSNFSVGQRQLVCLARVVLRKSRILVIDEATANVDLRTDRLIQQTIRDKFKHCTVLTIAHRIETIIDSDRVLVLDEGRVQEFDEPHRLLQKPNSSFTKLVYSMSETEADVLKNSAEKAYRSRRRILNGT